MKRLSILDVAACALVLVIGAATLIPAFARVGRIPADAQCQFNLKQWAKAMALYTADNDGRFPTNRNLTGVRLLNPALALSPPDPLPGETEPPRFYYSVNWVEALYGYLQDSASKTGQDWKTFRRCPNSTGVYWPPMSSNGYPFNCMTYALNYNLVEQPVSVSRDASKLMMLREFYKVTVAVLRPLNVSTGQSNRIPQFAFNNTDLSAALVENNRAYWKPHGEGSYIAFADGHVHYFDLDYYPSYSETTPSSAWDAVTQQWWNWAPGSGKSAPYLKSIAITP